MDYKKVYTELFNNNYNEYGSNDVSILTSLNFIKEHSIKDMIDISSGAGLFLKKVKSEFNNINIVSTDLDKYHDFNCEFIPINLSNDDDLKKLKTNEYSFLTCLDVLEHLDKSFIENVMENLARISKNSVISIANHSDIQNGIELHRIIENMNYWEPIVSKYFEILNVETHGFKQINGVNYLYVLTLKSK